MKFVSFWIGAIGLIAALTGCGSGTSPQAPPPSPYPPGLQVFDLREGTGTVATSGRSLTVTYLGTLTNGTVFDSSANNGGTPFTFRLGTGQVIRGWDLGLVGMRVGGKRKLIIPPNLAYGSQSNATIPANSTLIFDVDLLAVN